jgi:hypothetical protein
MLKRYQLNPAPICGDFSKPRRLGPGKRPARLRIAPAVPAFGSMEAMTGKEDRDDPRSPAELRAAFVKIEAVEHIGRHKRLFGRRKKITEQYSETRFARSSA